MKEKANGIQTDRGYTTWFLVTPHAIFKFSNLIGTELTTEAKQDFFSPKSIIKFVISYRFTDKILLFCWDHTTWQLYVASTKQYLKRCRFLTNLLDVSKDPWHAALWCHFSLDGFQHRSHKMVFSSSLVTLDDILSNEQLSLKRLLSCTQSCCQKFKTLLKWGQILRSKNMKGFRNF